ncbi:CopG family ribbon-helix-helix protein [Pantoea agglomerans]
MSNDKGFQVTVKLPESLKEKLDDLAVSSRRTRHWLILEALDEFVKDIESGVKSLK